MKIKRSCSKIRNDRFKPSKLTDCRKTEFMEVKQINSFIKQNI